MLRDTPDDVRVMREHVRDLARRHRVELDVRPNVRARAILLRGGVKIARFEPIRSTRTYYIALHELGHLIHPDGMGRGKAKRVEQERIAWQVALDLARTPPTPAVRRAIVRRLLGYACGATRRRNWTNPSDTYWQFLRELADHPDVPDTLRAEIALRQATTEVPA